MVSSSSEVNPSAR
jgi:hypothetical protein